MKKNIGFYLSAAGAALALISFFIYGSVLYQVAAVKGVLIAAVVVAAAVIAVTLAKGKQMFTDFLPVINAILMLTAVGLSSSSMASEVAYVITGLNPVSNATSFFTFVGVALVAWLLNVVAAFTGLMKKQA